jgi:predicted transcriptional regulator
MKPIEIPALDPEQLAALDDLYRSTRNVRLRTRAQMVLLAAERRMTASEIAEIVRASEETVRRFISSVTWPRGSRGCAMCRIRPGAPRKVTGEYRELCWWKRSGADPAELGISDK